MIYPYVWHFIKVILAYSIRVNVDFYTICFHIFDTTFKVLFSDPFQVLFLDQDEYFPVHWALIYIQTWAELKNSLYINLFINFIFFFYISVWTPCPSKLLNKLKLCCNSERGGGGGFPFFTYQFRFSLPESQVLLLYSPSSCWGLCIYKGLFHPCNWIISASLTQ